MKLGFLLNLATCSALSLCAGLAGAAELYSNGPVVGSNGKSVLNLPAATLGFNMQMAANNRVAEDFTVTSGSTWLVGSIDFFAYQNNATSFTLETVSWSIMSGNVNNGTLVASGTTALTNGGFVGYRVSSAAQNVTSKPIYRASADISDVSLAAGSYWLTWSMSGSLSSGPWQPTTADGAIGNAMQSAGGGAYTVLADTSTETGVTLPFVLNGTVSAVPEPASVSLMLLGAAGLLVARRRHQA